MQHRASLFLLFIACAFFPGCGSEDAQTISNQLARMVEEIRSEQDVPGLALAVDEPGRAEGVFTAGLADLDSGAPLTPQHHFRIASNTKTFTAAAIMLLKDEGRLSLDDSAGLYVPLLAEPPFDAITIRQLLSHRSGLFDTNNQEYEGTGDNYVDGTIAEDPEHRFTPEELIGVSVAQGLNFAPGEDFSYCDTGYTVLGLIVEAAGGAGMTYAEFIESRFIAPLGLAETSVTRDSSLPEPYARGYLYEEGVYEDYTHYPQSWEFGAGNMISTPADLARWARLLFGGQVVSAASTAEMMDAKPAGEHYYGLGCYYYPGLGYGHDGATVGFLSLMVYDPENDLALVGYVNLLRFSPVGLDEAFLGAREILGLAVPE